MQGTVVRAAIGMGKESNKKTLEDKSFQVAATRLWNTLPSEIRAIRGYDLFKGAINTYLFKKVFPYL